MNVEVRGEAAIITGYVNAVERYSKPIRGELRSKEQTFIERVRAGVFKTALKRNDDVKVLLNHNWDRKLANTKDSSAKLEEDNIGLRAEVVVTDKEIVEKARSNKLVGWSFGFYPNADEVGTEGEMTTRTLTDLDLTEVSILDDTKSPAYYGTSIETRSEEGRKMEIRNEAVTEEEQLPEAKEGFDYIERLAERVALRVVEMLNAPAKVNAEEKAEETEAEEQAEKRTVDYSAYEKRLAELK